jgi:hypothetical protein
MKEADAFRNKLAYATFNIARLSSTSGAVQRLIGADMWDDTDPTMVVAMGNEYTQRDNVIMPAGRTESFDRSSTGIYKGKLSDIDDLDKFIPVLKRNKLPIFSKKKPVHIFLLVSRVSLQYRLTRGYMVN